MTYDPAPTVAAAFGIAGVGELWRLTRGELSAAAADGLLAVAVAVVCLALVRSSLAALGTPGSRGRSDPRWSLAPLVALAGAHRLAELVPHVSSAAIVVTGMLAIAVSASLVAAAVRAREPPRPEHLFPTAATGYVLSVALAGAATVPAYAAFTCGTLGWLVVAGALARRGLPPNVANLTPPALGGLAWLTLHGAQVDAITGAFAVALVVAVLRLRWTAETTWTALFPTTAGARFVVTLSASGPARPIAWIAAAGVTAAVIGHLARVSGRPPHPPLAEETQT